MSNTKHAPGPWRIIPANQAIHQWVIGDKEGYSIADCEPSGPVWNLDEADANARLIAAAPDLFEALRSCLAEMEAWELDPEMDTAAEPIRLARAAIAKATGQTAPTYPISADYQAYLDGEDLRN